MKQRRPAGVTPGCGFFVPGGAINESGNEPGNEPGRGKAGVMYGPMRPDPPGSGHMNIDRIVMAFAGIVILAGLVLSHPHSMAWLRPPAFVGANMPQAAFT